ncbi:hypothetical protein EG327_004173 [Venturia inaequalis]|uniref:Uncharacterized protein n=1 Tax=Venturia inaequalis TaxID=5025 RepID=A0A8H3VD39_VENIN|nr:hypothetical protein EG327_004173 [Venturia inaequalis]
MSSDIEDATPPPHSPITPNPHPTTTQLQTPISIKFSAYPENAASTWHALALATPKFLETYKRQATEWSSLGHGNTKTRLAKRLEDARYMFQHLRSSIGVWNHVFTSIVIDSEQRDVWIESVRILGDENKGCCCFRGRDEPERFIWGEAMHREVLEAVYAIALVLEDVARGMERAGVESGLDSSWTVSLATRLKALRDTSRRDAGFFWSLLPGASSRRQVDGVRELTVQRESELLSRNLGAANGMQDREGLRVALTCMTVFAQLFLDTVEDLNWPEV